MQGLGAIFSRSHAVSYNEGLRRYMLGVYNYMTLALGISGLTAFLFAKSGIGYAIMSTPLSLLFVFLPVGISFFMSAKLMSASINTIKNLFFIYSISIGVSLSSVFIMFRMGDIARAFFITASTFGSMSIYGYATKRDLSKYSSMVMMLVFGLFIASIVNIFARSGALSFVVSFFSVILFTGLVAFDTQNIKKMYYAAGGNQDVATRVGIFGALQLYMDFVAIFIHLLNLLNMTRSSRD